MSPREPISFFSVITSFLKASLWCWLFTFYFLVYQQVLQGSEASTPPSQNLTANELLQQADQYFRAQQFEEAAALYQDFISQYASAPEVKEFLPNIRAHALIATAKSGQAKEAIAFYKKEDGAFLKVPALQLSWLVAVCQARFANEEYQIAREVLGQIFKHPAAQESHRQEVLQLAFQSFGVEEKWQEAIEFYEKYRATFAKAEAHTREAAQWLYLNALIAQEEYERAANELHQSRIPSSQTLFWIQLQFLRWQLAELLMSNERWDSAVLMLVGIRPYEELAKKLESSLADIERKLPEDPDNQDSWAIQIKARMQKLTELKQAFDSFENFDAVVRLRLANCFQSLERHREAAFVLDHMIRQMPPSEITESGTASLIRLWMLQERWSRAIRTAELYDKRFENFENTPHRPEILFLKGQAYQGLGHFEEAANTFAKVVAEYPDHEWATQAKFLEAHQYLHLNQEEEAIRRFQIIKSTLQGDLAEEVSYWLSMAHYFHQDWAQARTQFADYLKQSSYQVYRRDVEYRIAYTYFSEANFEETIQRLLEWKSRYAGQSYDDSLNEECLITLGDAYGATGELEDAIEAYRKVPVTSQHASLYDEAQFKIAQVYKVQKLENDYIHTLEAFLETRPESPKVAEALHALGKYYRSQNQVQKAQQIYWDSFTRLGPKEDQEGLEEMMLTLIQWQTSATFPQFNKLLEEKLAQAVLLNQPRWEQRLRWLKYQAALKFDSSNAPLIANEWRNKKHLESCSPRLLLDLAELEKSLGNLDEAKKTLETLRKWHPKSLYKDRAWLGLANLAIKQNHEEKAKEAFQKFYRYTLQPKVSVPDLEFQVIDGAEGGLALLNWSKVLRKGEKKEKELGETVLLAITKYKKYSAKIRAEALYTLAEFLQSERRFREAIAYYEQVYLLFPSHQPFAEKSYLGRAYSLRQLELPEKAKEVYQALLSLEQQASPESRAEAEMHLASLQTSTPTKP